MERPQSPMVRQLTDYKWKDAMDTMLQQGLTSVIVQVGPGDNEYSLMKRNGRIWRLTKTKYRLHITPVAQAAYQ
jgi:hypothetical protein